MFEWQLLAAFMLSKQLSKRESYWKKIKLISQLHFLFLLTGCYFSLITLFPEASRFGLVFVAIVFFLIKYVSLLVGEYMSVGAIKTKNEEKQRMQKLEEIKKN